MNTIKTSDDAAKWIESALLGKIYLPLVDRDDTPAMRVHAQIAAGKQRTVYRDGIEKLMKKATTGRPPTNAYMQELLWLAKKIKATTVWPELIKTANALRKSRNRFDWQTNRTILFALLELGIKGSPDFWKRMFETNPAELGAPAIAGMSEIDQAGMFELVRQLPNDQMLGDMVAINLDFLADRLGETKRKKLLEQTAAAAKDCRPHVKDSLETWLKEREEQTP